MPDRADRLGSSAAGCAIIEQDIMAPPTPSFDIPSAPPVIIIGMHRSGTSFLAKVLHQCGLFMGTDVQGNHESMVFMLINNGILINCNATWNRPFAAYLALQNPAMVDSLAQYAYTSLETAAENYLGSSSQHGIRRLADLDRPWGWKDPRNTFTLPVWRRIFPEIRVIHILRHGVDVANSIYQRDTLPYLNRTNGPHFPAINVVRGKSGLFHARPPLSLEQAFMLWEEYVEMATVRVKELGDNAIQIKYEDFLEAPRESLKSILAFCRLDDTEIPTDLEHRVDISRAYSYRQDEELQAFAEHWNDILSRFLY
ncbi:MAG TPA: sulfotransferase [Thiolapillus brandeum]|uniref:Sulfotransferase n=1 Tax=Thiolapillus brandeum TaxID=1076588 RepID=A0A831RW02_9GAMM|nr:sulfotransferase [Thiolapillus brandeum]